LPMPKSSTTKTSIDSKTLRMMSLKQFYALDQDLVQKKTDLKSKAKKRKDECHLRYHTLQLQIHQLNKKIRNSSQSIDNGGKGESKEALAGLSISACKALIKDLEATMKTLLGLYCRQLQEQIEALEKEVGKNKSSSKINDDAFVGMSNEELNTTIQLLCENKRSLEFEKTQRAKFIHKGLVIWKQVANLLNEVHRDKRSLQEMDFMGCSTEKVRAMVDAIQKRKVDLEKEKEEQERLYMRCRQHLKEIEELKRELE